MGKRFLAVAVILLFTAVGAGEGFARVGGGRSLGSRGSRSMSSPPRPSTIPSSPYRQGAAPAPDSRPQPQGGGFLRGMGAGMLGGLLGSMLGGGGCGSRPDMQKADPNQQKADPSQTGPAQQEESAGGMGFLDILLLAGLAYLAYRFFVNRRMQPQQPQQAQDSTNFHPPATGEADLLQGIGRIRQMDPSFDEKAFGEQAADLFFRIQGAWMRRGLAPVAEVLTDEMRGVLQADIAEMRAKGQVNRLENIAVRSVEIAEAWQESGQDFITARFLANLLDYTTDEAGNVLSGSDSVPVKFEEYWTLTRPVGAGAWKLSAIRQA